MALIRCVDQSSQTFRETYEDHISSGNELFKAKALDMMKLIEFLSELFKDINVYAFTTHGELRFVSGLNVYDPLYLCISSYGYDLGFTISYVIPEDDDPPWKDAMINGEALGGIEVAAKMILEAMLRSGRWKDKMDELRLIQSSLGSI